MNPYLLGINPWFFYALFMILAITGSIVVSRYKFDNIKRSSIGGLLVVLALYGFTSYKSFMSQPISEEKAEQLDLAINESFGNPYAESFRTALSELGEEKGNTTGGSTFALEGSKIYLDYVTRNDFNKLVKLYEQSKKIELN